MSTRGEEDEQLKFARHGPYQFDEISMGRLRAMMAHSARYWLLAMGTLSAEQFGNILETRRIALENQQAVQERQAAHQ